MRAIFGLFGRSPFAPLKSHMDNVASCINMLPKLFSALQENDRNEVELIADQISKLEHAADLMKNDIRNHLPKSLFLPMDHGTFLEILAIQDAIADAVEDVAVLVTLKTLSFLDSFKSEFNIFLEKNIETFNSAYQIIKELHDLLESSFGGVEAEKVRSLVDDVAYKEHEVDLIQRHLLKKIYQSENELTFATFYLWQRIFEAVSAVSNLSENLANRVRMTLEIK